MQYENLSVQRLYPLNGELNEHSTFKLPGYHQLLCLTAENEMTRCGRDIANTIAADYAWALTSMTVDVVQPLRDSLPVTARTWLSGIKLPYVRREVEMCREDGTPAVMASLFSVPFSVTTKGIIRDFGTGEIDIYDRLERVLVPDAQKHMRLGSEGWVNCSTRTVMPSDIDALGHMNNCRYGALIYDALTAEERLLFNAPFRYVIDFRHQLAPDAQVVIEKLVEGDTITVRGTDASTGKLSFAGRVSPLEV